mmetsp:Transcript_50576/g.109688  ORF Transcript_50576/g.109688 Transcript_50576/m.109688 type:complete len:137 (+) Transcript_50576:535-945(+)
MHGIMYPFASSCIIYPISFLSLRLSCPPASPPSAHYSLAQSHSLCVPRAASSASPRNSSLSICLLFVELLSTSLPAQVDSVTRGSGVGRHMIQAMCTIASKCGCSEAILNCKEHNMPFYAKCGFTPAGMSLFAVYF